MDGMDTGCSHRCGFGDDTNQSVLCATRDNELLLESFGSDCEAIILPEWFYSN